MPVHWKQTQILRASGPTWPVENTR
ncbi:hypothetical protein OYC64_007338 [Pagothenia borchgrevinki]|uniref:Uncharacterized protein n=1 Tax=Pagothenia borchgrevinki TaxID=8213 RepID=A0ABD2GS03_PAGBO